MPFQKFLDRIRNLRGVEAVAFLDSEGELILHSGGLDHEKLKIVGAYQGIFLSATSRLGFHNPRAVSTVYQKRTVLTRVLKEGYFICVIFSPDLNFAYAQFFFEDLCKGLESEL